MTLALFWLACAGLVALAGLMLATATRPRMPGTAESAAGTTNLMVLKQQLADLNAELADGRIDFEEHRLARGEMECRVIEELHSCAAGSPPPGAVPRRTIVLLTLAAAAAASALYTLLGNTAGLSPPSTPAATAAPGPDTDSRAAEAMLDDMAWRMSSQPPQSTDAAGWAFLGRSYAAVHRFESASDAYARALAQSPDDPQLLVDRADVLSMLQGRSTDGEPRRLIERALQLDPSNLKALALAGSDAFERKDFAAALASWSKARELAPAGAFADNMQRGIEEARAALRGTPTAGALAPNDPAPGPAAVIGGRVTVAQGLADRVRPGDVVFVFARAENGPRMPVAVARYDAGRLPIDFRLDDSSAMSAALRLSGFSRVVIGAHISHTGSATPMAGDLQGHSGVVAVGDSGVVVEIRGSDDSGTNDGATR